MALKAGKPTTAKERAIEAVKSTDDAPDTAKPKMKRFNVDIPEALHRDIKIQAAKEGTALNELTARLFNEYLSK
ncbi:MAG: toxin-antitoxin system HicB family antitoxin [Methylococcales bacterium]